MNPVSIVASAILIWIVPTPSVLAQAHKTKHGGGAAHKSAPAHRATSPTRPMTPSKTATQPQKTVAAHPAPSPHPPAKTDEELVASLRSTKAHLVQVEQDQRGHHARALSEVDNAIKLLGHSSSSPVPARPSHPPATTEIHLTEAQKRLREVESQMSMNGINAHQFIKARASIQTALRELNLALVDR